MHIRTRGLQLILLGSAWILTVPARADNIVTNGDFATGTLAGWSVFTTPNGTNGIGLPDVVAFNTTGAGATNSAQFNVGNVIASGTQQGGGISQSVIAPIAGLYSFGASIASQDGGGINADSGTFSILIDGTLEASDFLGAFSSPLEIFRGTLSGSVSLTPGAHTFAVEITRRFLTGTGVEQTPSEYLTDISLNSPSSVPEPSGIILMGSVLAGLAALKLRGKRVLKSR